jgi:hypothetical protein
MKMKTSGLFLLGLLAAGAFCVSSIGCKPKTTSQKIEDKAEDAQHEIKQGTERASENVEDAVKK